MEKLHLAVILAVIIGVSGCVQAEKQNQQNLQNPATVENKTPAPIQTAPNISETPAETKTAPALANEIFVAPGRSSSIVSYNGALEIAYQRFTGSSEDAYVASYSNGKIATPVIVSSSVLNEITPGLTVAPGKLYLFYTKTANGVQQSSNIYYKIYDSKWSDEYKANDFYDIWYPHNQSAVFYDSKILLFWTRGAPNEQGKIGSQYFDGSSWLDGIKVSGEIVNEKNPKVAASGNNIYMIYESYAADADSNQVYFRSYDGTRWSGGAESLSSSVPGAFKGAGSIAYYNSKIYALWFVNSAIYLSIKDGMKWSDPVKLTKDGAVYEEPSLAEYNGKLYVSYTKIQQAGLPYVYLAELQGI